MSNDFLKIEFDTVESLTTSFRQSLYSSVLSGVSLAGFILTFDQLLMIVSISSAVLSSAVSMSSLYRFYLFLRDRRSRLLQEGNELKKI